MQRTSGWTKSGVIFVVLCLLVSGGVFFVDWPPIASAQEQQTKTIKRAVPAPVERAKDKVDDAAEKAKEMAKAVRYSRWLRLDAHAVKMKWVLAHPPAEALRDKIVHGWWMEWCRLKAEFAPPPPSSKGKSGK